MRRFSGILALVLTLSMVALPAMAQDEQGGRRRGGPGGPGGRGFGMMGAPGGAMALMGLLRDEKVRKEVKVSDEAYEAVSTAQREAFGSLRDASEEERAKIMKDLNTKSQEMLEELVDPAGMKRLMGLLLQQQGSSAVTNELISKEIGLSEESSKAIQEVVSASMQERMTKMREMVEAAGGFQNLDREKMTAANEEATKKTNAAVEEKLTAEQKKAIEALKGEKFTFSEGSRFGGFGGGFGGPGGPGGGRPGGRQRPGSDN